MSEPNVYQHVIYKKVDDPDHKRLVNSLRYKIQSPSRYKEWSPDIHDEEKYYRKRLREDNYITKLK